MRRVFFIHFYEFEFLQHLHATLHLEGLRVRTLEAFDEVLSFLNHLLLFLPLLHLLLVAFRTKLEVLRVGHFIVVDSTHGYFNSTGSDIIHKLTVVADYNNSFSVID